MKNLKGLLAILALMVIVVGLVCISVWIGDTVNTALMERHNVVRTFLTMVSTLGVMGMLVWMFWRPLQWLVNQVFRMGKI